MSVEHPIAVPPVAVSLDVGPSTQPMILLACDTVSPGDSHDVAMCED